MHAGLVHLVDRAARSIGCAPHASSSTRTRTPAARAFREPCARTRVPISPSQYTKVSRSIVCSALSIASSIAGKISSPLRRTSTRLPSVAGTPMTPSRVRRSSSTRSLTSVDVVTAVGSPTSDSRRWSRLGVLDLLRVLRLAARRRGPLRAARRPPRRRARRPTRAAPRAAARRCRRADRRCRRTTCSTRKNSPRPSGDEQSTAGPRPSRRTRATTTRVGGGAATTGTAAPSQPSSAPARAASGRPPRRWPRAVSVDRRRRSHCPNASAANATHGQHADREREHERAAVLLHGRPVLLDAVEAVEARARSDPSACVPVIERADEPEATAPRSGCDAPALLRLAHRRRSGGRPPGRARRPASSAR